jgi:hypothetical protein
MNRHVKKWIFILIGFAFIYVFFFPSPTPAMAVRMELLFRQPILALSEPIVKGNIENDPMYGDLYIVNKARLPFIYVKKYKLGWHASSGGSAP